MILARTIRVLLGALGLIVCVYEASSQIQFQQGFSTKPLGKDTLCYSYRWVAGDTAFFAVETNDSISLEGQPVLIKHREEVVRIVCDSVTSQNHYVVTMSITSMKEWQSTGTDSAIRTTSPWIGRAITITMDSVGKRYGVRYSDSRPAVSPGGPFAPSLLPILASTCGRQNESWEHNDTTVLVENAIPYPVLLHSTLWRVLDRLDTMGQHLRQIQYTMSGRGRVDIQGDGMSMIMSTITNGYGKLTFDSVVRLPFHSFTTMEHKISLELANGVTREGKHLSARHVRLTSLVSPDSRRAQEAATALQNLRESSVPVRRAPRTQKNSSKKRVR